MHLRTTEKVNNKKPAFNKVSILIDVLLALMLGGACFYVFISMFGLRWPGSGMFSGGISSGLAGIWDKIADKLGNLDYIILPKFKASEKTGTALTMILAAFSVISYFIIKSRTKLLMLLFALPIGVMMLFYGVTPSVYAGGFFAAAVIIVLAVMRIDGDIDPKYLAVPLAILLAAGVVLAVADRTVSLREPRELAAVGTSIKDSIDRMRYGKDPLPAGDLGSISGKDLKTARGDIESVKETLGTADDTSFGSDLFGYDSSYGTDTDDSYGSDTDESSDDSKKDNKAGSKTALTVKMNTPDSYYLRGFIGASYNRNKWSTLSNDTFYGMRDKIFWLNRRDFDGLSQMSRASELGNSSGSGFSYGEGGSSFGLPIDNDEESDSGEGDASDEEDEDDSEDEEGDDNEVIISDDDDSESDDEDDEEDPFTTVGFFDTVYAEGEDDDEGGNNRISIKVKGASKRFAFVPYELVLRAASDKKKARKSEMVLPKGTKNYGGSHLGTEGVAGKSSYSYVSAGNITGSWTDAVGKLYTASSSEDIESYFISESHYNVMQYENYLEIPDKIKSLINSEIGSPGDMSENHAEYKETIDRISNYLSGSFIYSESFEKPKGKDDVIEKFIESKSGCDMHFASLATLMFRYFGIPARYVEGYLVTPSMVEGKEDHAEIDVTRRSSHAWTEIYIDGFGWVPFEATPEYEGIMKEADMQVGLQNVDYESTPPQPDESEDIDDYDDEEDISDAKVIKKLLKMFLILIILAVIILLLYIAFKFGRRIMEERRWQKAFADKDPKKGVKALYQYANNHGWILSEQAQQLGLAASYSTAVIQESDRKMMLAEFNKAKERDKKDRAAAKVQAQKEHAAAKAAEKQEKEQVKKEKAAAKAAEKQEKEKAKKEKAEGPAEPVVESAEPEAPAEAESVVGKHDADQAPEETEQK